MKIVTYNIWDGFENNENRKNLCAQWLKDQAPDILFLNELNNFTDQSLQEYASQWQHPHTILLNGRSAYKIGITSRYPISNIELYSEELEGHGLIQCKSNNIYLLNTHLHPHSIHKRIHDIEFICNKIKSLLNQSKNLIFGGDLNAIFHGEEKYYLDEENHFLKFKNYVNALKVNSTYPDSRNNEVQISDAKNLIFSVTKKISETKLSDLLSLKNNNFQISMHTKIGKEAFQSNENLIKSGLNIDKIRSRIDYLWSSSELSHNCLNANVINDQETNLISDHFPVVANFK